MMSTFTHDLRYASRLARRTPGATLLIVLVLGLGMGASTAVFTVLDNTLLRPMLLERVDELVRIDDVSVGPEGTGDETNISPLNVEALRQGTRTLAAVTVQQAQWFVLTGGDEPERVRGAAVSDSWNRTLGVQPVLGRGFTEEELRGGGRGTVALLGYDLWQRRFGGSSAVLGRTLLLNGEPRTVVGVMPRGFRFPYEAEVWVPIHYDPQNGAAHYLLAIARRKRGASLEAVNAELATISRRLATDHAETNADWRMRAQDLRENLVRGSDRVALSLLATVAFLLILSSVNVAALMLARMQRRRRELLVRAALGASRGRQLRQITTEALLLASGGALVALGVTYLLFPVLGALVPPVMSVELAQNELVLDGRVFAFALSLLLVTVLLSGLLPAYRAVPRDLQGALREGERGGGSLARRWSLRALVFGEVVLAIVLLVGSAGVILGFTGGLGGRPGYEADDVLTMRLSLADADYTEPESRTRTLAALLEQLRALPGVRSVAATTTSPRLGSWTAQVTAASADPSAHPVDVQLPLVSPGYFATMRVALAGRDFTSGDGPDAPPVAIVSRDLASALWPGRSAIGERVRLDPDTPPLTVVGIAASTRWAERPDRALYVPYAQVPVPLLTREVHLMVRTLGQPTAIFPSIRERIRAVDPHMPVFGVAPLADVRGPEYLLERTGALISGGFASLGLSIALMGIFGGLMHAILAARREHAIRLVMGAAPRDIFGRHLRELVLLLGAGSLVGALGGAALNRVLRHFIPAAATVPPPTYALLIVGMVVTGCLAAVWPALQAARSDPAAALREV